MIAAALVVFPLAGGCGGGEDTPRATVKHPVERTATPTAAGGTPSGSNPKPSAPAVPAAARRAAARLPLEQRVAQLFVVGFDGAGLEAPVFEDLAGHGWGGIVIGAANAAAADGVSALAGEAAVIARNGARPVPFVATDESVPGLPVDPAGRRALGLTLNLGPHADVPIDEGADPAAVGRRVRRGVREGRSAGLAVAVGHFPGQGAASQDPLDGPAQVGLSEAELRGRDLVPFQDSIAARVPVIVVSSASFLAFDPVTPGALVPGVVGGLLRNDFAFGGVAMTDDIAGLQAATGSSAGTVAVDALKAGMDLVYVPDPRSVQEAYSSVLAAVKAGRLSPARVRDACARVLAVKAVVLPAAEPTPAPG